MSSTTMIKYLLATEKILAIVSLLMIIPLILMLVKIKNPFLKEQLKQQFKGAFKMMRNSFIVDYLRDKDNKPVCASSEAVLHNDKCFQRANASQSIVNYDLNQCRGGYTYDEIRYCPGRAISEIKNSFDGTLFIHSEQTMPVYSIIANDGSATESTAPTIIYYSCISREKQCLNAGEYLQTIFNRKLMTQNGQIIPLQGQILLHNPSDILSSLGLILLFVLLLSLLLMGDQCSTEGNCNCNILFLPMLAYNGYALMVSVISFNYHYQVIHWDKSLLQFHTCFRQPLNLTLSQLGSRIEYGEELGSGFINWFAICGIVLILICEITIMVLYINFNQPHREHYLENGFELRKFRQ